MHNSHMEFPHQAVKRWQCPHPAASAAGPSHPSRFPVIFPAGSVPEGLIPQPFLTPSCPVCLPAPLLPSEPLVLLGIVGSAGTPRESSAAAFCPRARSLSGQWQEAPASPSAGAGAARGRCSARAALFGADKLRKPGRRMEGSVRNLGPGAAGLSTGFPRPGRGVMILESAWQPREHGDEPAGVGWMQGGMQGWL